MKLIAYWTQYKMVLKYIPFDQTYYIYEFKYRIWDDGKVYESGLEFRRCEIDRWNLDFRGIKRSNLDRISSELYDWLKWNNRYSW